MLVKAGSGALTSGQPDSPGVPGAVAADTLVCSYNDLRGAEKLLKEREAACVIVEPVAANMGVVLPKEGLLRGLRGLCDTYGSLLIMDEVITGFRLCKGGAQEYFDVKADLATYGKIIGGGLPIGAYGGKREIMELVAPSGPVYQAGTLAGNPVAMAAGLAQLRLLENGDVYERINREGERLAEGLSNIIMSNHLKACVNHAGSLVSLFFGTCEADDFQSVKKADAGLFARFFREMLSAGVYLAPSQFEAMFVSAAHTEKDIDETLGKAEQAMVKMKMEGVL
jgi:glutamate-1-semialdehyde 2,1-aminomutase